MASAPPDENSPQAIATAAEAYVRLITSRARVRRIRITPGRLWQVTNLDTGDRVQIAEDDLQQYLIRSDAAASAEA